MPENDYFHLASGAADQNTHLSATPESPVENIQHTGEQ